MRFNYESRKTKEIIYKKLSYETCVLKKLEEEERLAKREWKN